MGEHFSDSVAVLVESEKCVGGESQAIRAFTEIEDRGERTQVDLESRTAGKSVVLSSPDSAGFGRLFRSDYGHFYRGLDGAGMGGLDGARCVGRGAAL